MMESKVAEAMSKKETLKARALTAETTKQLNESITSMVCPLLCAINHFITECRALHHEMQSNTLV